MKRKQKQMKGLRKAGIRMAVKADTTKRIISGYASTFNNMDQGGDVVMPGAFTATIQRRFPKGKIKVLYQHDMKQPIGLPVDMREDSKGLFVSARISETAKGDETLRLIDDKVIDSFSIGYDIIKSQQFEDEEMRALLRLPGWWPMTKLTEIKLYEFSPVTFPMNEEANIISSKSQCGTNEFADVVAVKTLFGWLPVPVKGEDGQPSATKAGILLTAAQAAAVATSLKSAQQIIAAAETVYTEAAVNAHDSAKADDGAASDLPSDAAPSEAKADSVSIGDFVSWEGGQGRVTSADDEDGTALVQVFAGDTPTDEIISLDIADLSVTDAVVPEPDAAEDSDAKAFVAYMESMATEAEESKQNKAIAALFS